MRGVFYSPLAHPNGEHKVMGSRPTNDILSLLPFFMKSWNLGDLARLIEGKGPKYSNITNL